jgi:3-oxoacyl-[acyl-carrier-protein] synthase II
MTRAGSIDVVGVGTVGAHGIGLEALGAALARGQPLRSGVTPGPHHHRPGARQAALAGHFDLSPLLPGRAARRMSPLSRMAVAAATLALRDAPGEGQLAVVLGTGSGATSFTERLRQEIVEPGPEAASPFLFTDCVANAPAGQIAIAHGARAANATICQREASGLIALDAAVRELRHGRAARALCGTADEMTPFVHAVLDRGRALARQHGETPRPFDQRRDGCLAGEGATVLLLEPEGRAPLARVAWTCARFDPTSSRHGFGREPRTIAAALIAGGLDRAGIDAVVCSASGSRHGDRYESEMLRALWPTALPPLLTPKAVIGEYGGGTLAAAIAFLHGRYLGAPQGGFAADPELDVRPHHGPLARPPARVLVDAVATGGACAFAVLERPGQTP